MKRPAHHTQQARKGHVMRQECFIRENALKTRAIRPSYNRKGDVE